MTGTAAASPVSTPFAFKKKPMVQERNEIWKSKCCGSPPEEPFDRNGLYKGTQNYLLSFLHGLCSKCKQDTTFIQNKLPLNPAPNSIKEMTTTGAVSGYNIPGAFSKRGGSEAGLKGSEKLGFTLTKAGKEDMTRVADKLR